jgi:hypothetical protein
MLHYIGNSNTLFVPVEATGGTESIITLNGIRYKTHTFTASGNFVVTKEGVLKALVVAGGAGSSWIQNATGGGGGGEVLELPVAVSINTYPMVVGLGGYQVAGYVPATNGQNSTAFSLTARGGTASQANTTGGNSGNFLGGTQGASNTAGGGAGAAEAGKNGTTTKAGAGGNGYLSSISGTPTYYGGGGGGGASIDMVSAVFGEGGLGGGGRGAQGVNDGSRPSTDGTPNTGGGAGGNAKTGTYPSYLGKLGGSGIIILAYQII